MSQRYDNGRDLIEAWLRGSEAYVMASIKESRDRHRLVAAVALCALAQDETSEWRKAATQILCKIVTEGA